VYAEKYTLQSYKSAPVFAFISTKSQTHAQISKPLILVKKMSLQYQWRWCVAQGWSSQPICLA